MSYRRNYQRFQGNNRLPKRWDKYTAIGNVVPGTRFLPFKTPLKEEICTRQLSEREWFTPAMLLEKAPRLKLIIDLTQTDRFYSNTIFIRNGILHKKIRCIGGGRQLPPRHIIHEFNAAIESFLQSEDGSNSEALIGVHCTHGLNRTGYLICKYMVEHNGISAQKAIEDFESARGHKMERDLYVKDILESGEPYQIAPRRSRSPNDSSSRDVAQRYDTYRRQESPTRHRSRSPRRWRPLEERRANAPYSRSSILDRYYEEDGPYYRNLFYPYFGRM